RTDRSRLLAARASLELARPRDEMARAIRLTVPLDRALLAKKAAMEQALSAYARAAQYGVAEVSTPATYAMAELYRHLGKALLDSERPRDLSPDELEQYQVLLEEQAFPFEEKAIEIHESNAQRAAGGIYDDWVRKSFVALAELKPARYARNELDPESKPAAAESAPSATTAAAPVAPAPAAAIPPEVVTQLANARAALTAGRDAEAADQL